MTSDAWCTYPSYWGTYEHTRVTARGRGYGDVQYRSCCSQGMPHHTVYGKTFVPRPRPRVAFIQLKRPVCTIYTSIEETNILGGVHAAHRV